MDGSLYSINYRVLAYVRFPRDLFLFEEFEFFPLRFLFLRPLFACSDALEAFVFLEEGYLFFLRAFALFFGLFVKG